MNYNKFQQALSDSSTIFSVTQQIVFIDSQIEDYQSLAAGVIPGTEVVILDANRNGIEQISTVLSQRDNSASVHIVSHGSPGCIYLGNSQLNLDNLEQYASDLQNWFNLPAFDTPLSKGGDLILYGCNVAAGDAGAEFVEKLQAVTKTSIAASNSLTGSTFLGGNWNLEVQVGEILTKTTFTPQVLADYQGILNTPTSPLSLTEQSSEYSVGLKPLSALLSQQLATWFSQEDFLMQAAIPFGGTAGSSTWTDNALALQESILNGTYSIGLEVRSASEMKGALGAYSSTGTTNEATIYLNEDWLETASNNRILAVLLEELGHDFDHRLNSGADSQGDEGQLFASMVSDRVLSEEEQASIASENDDGLLKIDGQDVAVEFATVNINNGDLNFSVPVPKVGTGALQGNIVLYTGVYAGVDAIITTTQVDTGITITDFDSILQPNGTTGNEAGFFSPRLLGSASVNGKGAAFNIQFIEAGSYNNTTNTGTPITLQNFKLNSYDIDIKQFQNFSSFNSASLILGGQLGYTIINPASGLTNFFSTSTTNLQGNMQTSSTGRVQVTYDEISSINVSMGSNDYSQLAGAAFYFLDFGPGDTTWTPTTLYVPKLDLDANNSTTTGANYQTTFIENGTAVSIGDVDTLITDADDTNIESATIILTNAQANDLLAAGTLPGGITASAYNSATGVITLTGSATRANYQAAIRAITFNNTSDNPSTTPRSVTVVVNDGGFNSNTATTTINVTPVNDPPVLDLDSNNSTAAGNNYQTTFTENGTAVSIGDTDTTITDADDTNIESATITLTNAQASDLLAAGTLPTGITTTGYNSATGVITLTGSATRANYQTAIKAITFNNTSDNPSTTPRSVTVVVNDGEFNSNTATTTITVTPVNDPPVLDLDSNNSTAAGNNYQTTFTENGTAVPIGDTDTLITDADDTNIESATITLTNAQASDLLAAGTLPGGITASAYNSATGVITLTGSATLANYQTAIQAITFNNTSDNPSTTPRSVTVVVNDGEFNSNTATTTITVTPVNDPPVLDLDSNNSTAAGANYQTTFTENGTAVPIGDTDTLITDADDTNIESATITLTNAQASDLLAAGTLPGGITASAYNSATGVITLTGSATLANYQTAIQAITFNNTSDNPSTTPRSVTVVVNDGEFNSNTATTTITVTPVNDPPVLDLDSNNSTAAGANYQTTFTENGTAVPIGDTDTLITDVDDTNIESATITLTNAQASDLLAAGTLPGGITASAYNSATGVITLTGSATLANYQTAIQAITFNNTSDNPSTTPRSVTVVVNDGEFNSNTATTTITVTPVNDPPVLDLDSNNSTAAGANYQTTFTENGTAVPIGDTDTLITDVDDTNIESATITLTNAQASDLLAAGTLPGGITASAYNSATGVITLTGSATLANYQAAIQAITFNNTSDNPSTTPRSVTVVVNDGGFNSNTATTTITVTPVNDPPVLDLDANNNSTATGANYQTTFTENGTAVSIGDVDTLITDADDTNIESATITLTNAQASDLLAAGTLPTGITTTGYNSATGTITLTGSATLANYQAAIQAITFNNTSANPSTIDRNINVIVNDGDSNSNTATTTIEVFDLIKGTDSPDTLTGGAGNDLIIGNKGEDTLTGGAGNDYYYLNETSDGVDSITDFTPGEDKINLSQILNTEVTAYTTGDPFAQGYVELVEFNHPTLGLSTIVQIDFDAGNGATENLFHKDVVFLQGVDRADLDTSRDFII